MIISSSVSAHEHKHFPSDMRITFLHGWLRGNLGDACISEVVVRSIRSRFPSAYIRFYTEPSGSWVIPSSIRDAINELVPYDYTTSPDATVSDADVVIQAPGGGLQDPDDARAPYMIRDARFCAERGIPYAMAGHSFHPSYDLSAFARCFILAREPESHALLTHAGIVSVPSADPAFLADVSAYRTKHRRGTAVFLRRWHLKNIELRGHALALDGRDVSFIPPLRLASSDPLRDDTLLAPLQTLWSVPYERCMDIAQLYSTIAAAERIMSDRYHPIIFASLLGVPSTFITRQGSLRDAGLQKLLAEQRPEECRRLAQQGLEQLCDFIATASVRQSAI